MLPVTLFNERLLISATECYSPNVHLKELSQQNQTYSSINPGTAVLPKPEAKVSWYFRSWYSKLRTLESEESPIKFLLAGSISEGSLKVRFACKRHQIAVRIADQKTIRHFN